MGACTTTNTSVLPKKQIVHPQYNRNENSSQGELETPNFALDAQPHIKDIKYKQLWLIRHGERMDEVDTSEAKKWRDKTPDNRSFDPPLTTNGFKQGMEKGILLNNELNNIDHATIKPKYIYASPMARTIGTAMGIARQLELPIMIIPGLCQCAAAVKHGGLIKKNMNQIETEHNDYELFLKQYGWVGECVFLTKKEIIKRFAKKGVSISFDYRVIESFEETVKRLVNEADTDIVLCVTHREGMRDLDTRLRYSNIRFCALAKFAFMDKQDNFVYFED